MKYVLSNKNFKMEFTRIIDFYNILEMIKPHFFNGKIIFDYKDLDKIETLNKTIGLPSFKFLTYKDKKLYRFDNELKEELEKVEDSLNLQCLELKKKTKKKKGKKVGKK